MNDVLDLIDNAIADHRFGPDAVRLSTSLTALAESVRASLAPSAAAFARLVATLRPPSAVQADRYARARHSRAQYGQRHGHGR